MGHLPKGLFEPQLKAYFEQFGKVLRLRLSRSKKVKLRIGLEVFFRLGSDWKWAQMSHWSEVRYLSPQYVGAYSLSPAHLWQHDKTHVPTKSWEKLKVIIWSLLLTPPGHWSGTAPSKIGNVMMLINFFNNKSMKLIILGCNFLPADWKKQRIRVHRVWLWWSCQNSCRDDEQLPDGGEAH